MDRDIVILKYERDVLQNIEQETEALKKANDVQGERLNQVSERIATIYEKLGKNHQIPKDMFYLWSRLYYRLRLILRQVMRNYMALLRPL